MGANRIGMFWARLGVDVGEFCAALYAAFKAQANGATVVREFARGARHG